MKSAHEKDTNTPIFTAAQSVIVKTWKKHRWLSKGVDKETVVYLLCGILLSNY